MVKNPLASAGDSRGTGLIPGLGRFPGEGNGNNTEVGWKILENPGKSWKIPWTEGPGGPQSMGSQRVGHDWATEHAGHWPLGHEVHKFLQTLPNSLDTKSPLTENHRFMKLYINIKFTRTAKQSTTVGWLNRCLLCHSSGGEKCEVHMWAGLHSSGSWERMCPRSLP